MESVGLAQLNGSNQKSVSLEQIGQAAQARSAAVTAEAAGYIVLLIVREMTDNWSDGEGQLVEVGPEGELDFSPGCAVSQKVAELALCRQLAHLLEFARAPSPALLAIASRPATASCPGLEKQLLSALVPLNEAAARRGLARLWRQTSKYGDLHGWQVRSEHGKSLPETLAESHPHSPEVTVVLSRARPAEQLSLFDDSIVLPNCQSLRSRELSDVSGVGVDEIPVEVDCSDWAIPSSRSDLRELIGGFLAESNSEERLSRELRRSIGIEE